MKSPDTRSWRRKKSLWARLWRANNSKDDGVNWLQDRRMLPAAVERARCDWPADLFQPSGLVQKRIDEYALLLLDGIQRRPSATNGARGEERPLFFIASCLGGVILIKALVDAHSKRSNYRLIRITADEKLFIRSPFSHEFILFVAPPGSASSASYAPTWSRMRRPNPLRTMLAPTNDAISGGTPRAGRIRCRLSRGCCPASGPRCCRPQ
jgi:hypothetical protein